MEHESRRWWRDAPIGCQHAYARDNAPILGGRNGDRRPCATAVAVGADRFITNNSGDFSKSITEVEVIYPSGLPEP